MRMNGTSRQFVSSQSFRGEMARRCAASAGRRSNGSGWDSRARPSDWFRLVLSIGVLRQRRLLRWQPEYGCALASEAPRRRHPELAFSPVAHSTSPFEADQGVCAGPRGQWTVWGSQTLDLVLLVRRLFFEESRKVSRAVEHAHDLDDAR